MHWTGIVAIVVVVAIVSAILFHMIKMHREGKHLDCCEKEKHGSDLVKAYHKKYGAKNDKQ